MECSHCDSGGKETDFEGGIRAISLVSGGYLPAARQGAVENGLMHGMCIEVCFASVGTKALKETQIEIIK